MKHNPFLVYLFAALWCWAPFVQLRAIPLHVFVGGATSASGDYSVNTAVFDGTNDYTRRNATFTSGAADGKVVTFAFWIKMHASSTNGSVYRIFETATGGSSSRVWINRSANNTIGLRAANSSGTTILSIDTATTFTAGGAWTHVYFCADLANTSLRKIYINGVSETITVNTYTDATIDWVVTGQQTNIGSTVGAANKLYGSLAEFWGDDVYLDDPTKFYSGGNPVNVGSDGSTPNGSQPLFYFSSTGSGNSWGNNGTAGSFTVTGTLDTDTSP